MVAPIWLVPGWMKRASMVKEGKMLKDQLNTVTSTAQAAQQALSKKGNLLMPGAAIAGTGLLAGKLGTDALAKKQSPSLPELPTSFMNSSNSAEFVLGLAASLENAAASTMIALRNAKLKKRIADVQATADTARIALEGKRAKDLSTLGAIGLGSIGLGVAGTTLGRKTTTPNPLDDLAMPSKMPSNFSNNTNDYLSNIALGGSVRPLTGLVGGAGSAGIGVAFTKKHFMGK